MPLVLRRHFGDPGKELVVLVLHLPDVFLELVELVVASDHGQRIQYAHLRDSSSLRSIPSVERILSSGAFAALITEFGRSRVKDGLAVWLDGLRTAGGAFDERSAADAVRVSLQTAVASTLRRVINASGIIIHTNLGRAPIDGDLWARAGEIAKGYSNLEFDVEAGERGARDRHLGSICRTLFDCEAALLTNNNAAATLLLLAAVAPKREVLVSRGELVEIGGSFRVPDVIQQGGAKLQEVGTTNRTRARDYASAVTKKTAAILRVSRSNFDIVGFTETPSIEELVEVARSKKLPLLYDEGSGRVVDVSKYGFRRRDTLRELIAKGVDVITCSTDKLIGATQGGLILGRAEILEKIRKHPLMRALRAGKESYAVIAETLRAFATDRHEQDIAIYRILAMPIDALRANADAIVRGTQCRVIDSQCALGGGTTPTETIPSIAIAVPGKASELAGKFLRNDPPIVGRIEKDRFTLEVRTLLDADRPMVAAALRTTSG
ncbi:MAG: L-seryl-tRNA(Sec) selenium transferase [Acidobacteriota bacterium]|nr:L-seryl-tRNA(Sec) selenium transferase [Acidobacteriota bacterium]